jgi:hypothetical protein
VEGALDATVGTATRLVTDPIGTVGGMVEPFAYVATHIDRAPRDFMAGVNYMRSQPVSTRVRFLSSIAVGTFVGSKLPAIARGGAAEFDEAAVVQAAAARITSRGTGYIDALLSPAQRAAGGTYPNLLQAYRGYVLHQQVALAVADRFTYSDRGVDYTSIQTGVQVELTTVRDLAAHQIRYGQPGPGLGYATYSWP